MKVVFVWEGLRSAYFYFAEKLGTWSEMEKRAKAIQEAIEKAEEIKELVEKADEYGVLKVKVSFRYFFRYEGYSLTGINMRNNELEFKVNYGEGKEIIEEKITENPISQINEFIDNLKLEYEKQKEYMREAEKYLKVLIES